MGAGDGFSAAFLFAYISGKSPLAAAKLAARVGGFVAASHGALPEYPEDLREEIELMHAQS